MRKFNSKNIILCLLMIFSVLLVAVSGVCAQDINTTDNITDLNNNDIKKNHIINDENKTSENQNAKKLNATGTFDDLQVEINKAHEGSVLNLTRDYNGAYGSRIQFNKDLTIDGQGHTLDCLNTECTAFYSSSGNITLMNLIIINGHNDDNYNGGAIHIEGSAQYTIINCTLNNNWADDYGGAIYNGVNKPLTIINSSFNNNEADDENGGAIYSVGDICLENSLFNSNHANEDGGAICSKNSVYINNCTFKDNCADNSGGAIYTYYTIINNSLFDSNKADNDGGAINAINNAQLKNDIFTRNTAKNGGASYAYVLNSDNSTFKDNKADNGGAIYASSALINSFKPNSNSFFINNIADNCGGAIFSKNKIEAINSEFYKNNACEDGGAIFSDNAYVSRCLFDSNKATGAKFSQCEGGSVYCQNDLSVENSTFKNNYADDYGGALYSKEDSYIKNTVFIGNNAYEDGGAIFCNNASIAHCLFELNKATGAKFSQCEGGSVYCQNDLSVENSTFKNNYADDYGGAVYAKKIYVNNNQNTYQSYNSFFINNGVNDNDGGALYSKEDSYIKNTVFIGNNAYEDGGAIFCNNASIAHCLFELNKATGAKFSQCEGGSVYCQNDLSVENSTFKNNYADDYGGAIYADTLDLKHGCNFDNTTCIFDNNTAYDNQGGAIWVNKFKKDVIFATFINNKAGAKDDGGAIYINKENHITFSTCTFKGNYAGDEGGAIYLDSLSSDLTLIDNTFINNQAGNEGQVVFNKGTYGTIKINHWGTKSPDFSRDLLVEWKVWESNVKHKDENPSGI